MLGFDGCDGVLEFGARAVVEGVIADDFPDLDTVTGEEFRGPQQNPGRDRAFLVAVDLGIRQTGVVIDHGVDVVKAQTLVLGLVSSAAAEAVNTPASALGDQTEFLDIDMHQIPRLSTLVAPISGLRGANDLPGNRIQRSDRWELRRAKIAETVRAGTPVTSAIRSRPRRSRPSCHHTGLHLGWCSPRHPMKTTGSVSPPPHG